jgi:putative ABC transport system ATP-binding protein
MSHLRIEDLTIEYVQGDYVVRPIESLDLDAGDGELVLLLGPSGSGKTTLLSCLAAILTPARGKIWVQDTEVTSLRGMDLARYRRHGVGIVFQAFNLVASLNARENVMAPLRLAGISLRSARARAEELLGLVGLEQRLDHRPRALSGGQQQRVAIARALVHDPPLIVADEPTAHLDYVQVEEVARIVRRLARPGRLVVIATHDERLVPLADRIVELLPPAPGDQQPPPQLSLHAGQVLFRQGEPSDWVYVVEAGEVELFRDRPDGGQDVLRRVFAGGYFGEMGPLLRLPRSASARAVRDVKVSAHSAHEFRQHSNG